VDRNVDLVIQPCPKLGEDIVAADQRELADFGDEKVELAWWLARSLPATPLRRRELLPQQREAYAGQTSG
jgi:hypothetical protein